MKARICGLLAVIVALMVVALPMRVWAHDDDDENEGWQEHHEHHDHGLHRGWYKHHHGPDADDYGQEPYYNEPYVGGCAAQPGINYGHLPRQRASLLTEMNNNYGRYETARRNGNYSRANFLRERLANEQYQLQGIDGMLNCPPGAAYPSNYPAPSIYGAPSYGAAGYGAPGYGAAGYGAPGYGAAGYGAPGYGAAGTPDLGSLIGSLSQYMGNGASPGPYAGQYPPSSNSPYPGQYPAGGSYSPYAGQYPASGGASSLAAIAQMLGF